LEEQISIDTSRDHPREKSGEAGERLFPSEGRDATPDQKTLKSDR